LPAFEPLEAYDSYRSTIRGDNGTLRRRKNSHENKQRQNACHEFGSPLPTTTDRQLNYTSTGRGTGEERHLFSDHQGRLRDSLHPDPDLRLATFVLKINLKEPGRQVVFLMWNFGAGDQARTRNFRLGNLIRRSFIFNTYKTV
jgi:hypothetical protein